MKNKKSLISEIKAKYLLMEKLNKNIKNAMLKNENFLKETKKTIS